MSTVTVPAGKRAKIQYVEADQLPELNVTYTKQDISDAISIRLHIDRGSPSGLLLKDAVPLDLTKGMFKFAWDSGDLVPGLHPAEIEIVNAASQPLTIAQFDIEVSKQIA